MIWLVLGCTPEPPPMMAPTPVPTPPVEETGRFDTSYELEEPWVLMLEGTFEMGSVDPEEFPLEVPQHAVTVPTFAIMRREVTVAEYEACVDAGVCTPRDGCLTNPVFPVNCVDWYQARAYCSWAGGRLPSEAEWEFAATSRGQDNPYPWGQEPPDCTRANVGDGMGNPDCGSGMWEPCTHPAGDTPMGLCEMGGNAFEWTEDWFWGDYVGHPTDGSPQLVMNFDFKSMRGGAIGSGAPPRTRARTFHPRDFTYGGMGARCVMDL